MASRIISEEKSKEINDPNFLYVCTKCKLEKPNKEYSTDNSKIKGRKYVTQCKVCRRKYSALFEVLERKRELAPNQRNKHRLSVIFWSSKQNAKKRKLEHNIDLNYIREIFEKQKGLCYYTNKPMFIDTRNEYNNEDSVSLDRFDSSKGYIKGNIVLCKWIVNRMKNDINFNKFLELVSDINNNFKS